MTDKKPPFIPAVVRALLEPFRNIMAIESDASEKGKYVQTTFLMDHDRPSEKQVQAIGRVATTWSILERVLGITLSRLALAPEFPASALTKDLSLDNQVKAAKTLIALHRDRYQGKIIDTEFQKILTKMLTELATLKDERNIVVHTVWFRMAQDELHALRPRPLTLGAASGPSTMRTTAQIEKFADEIQRLADAMFTVAQLLPDVDEARHAQSLALEARHLPRETPSKPEDPPQSSEA